MKLIVLLCLLLGSYCIVNCPKLTCKDLEDLDSSVDEDDICYISDAQHPTFDLKSYPCPNGKKCEITSFDNRYAFVTTENQNLVPTYPNQILISEPFKKKTTAYCMIEGDLLRNLTAGRKCMYDH